jgi:SAM-dependent methyltransferase
MHANGLCHVCGALAVAAVAGYEKLGRVTSDCKPWPRGGRLGGCRACGCVQKVLDQAWRSEIDRIYADYSIYYQSNGVEQAVYESRSGRPALRSERLLEQLRTQVPLPRAGRLLDVGCGNGAFLRAFSRLIPHWTLAGTELNAKYREEVERITGVEALYACAPDQVPGRFQMISMIHVLEHIPAPRDFLVRLQDRLEPGGLLFVEIPSYLQNPYDLLVADHASHFTVPTATRLLQSAGYEVVHAATDWIPKELTLVARKAPRGETPFPATDGAALEAANRTVRWLEEVVSAARASGGTDRFGIFGTSITATWLFKEIEEQVRFFVDEDPHRAGKTFMNLPVYHPRDTPSRSHVFLGLPRKLAESVQQRLARSDVVFHLPPPLVL